MPRRVYTEKEKEENRKTYLYFKEHHICTCCHHRPARPGRTQCEVCAAREAQRKRREREKETAAARAERYKRENAARREKHRRLKLEGRCPICGKPVKPPNVYCIDCRIRQRRYSRKSAEKRKKKHSDNPELCCKCDAPALPGKRLCAHHYKKALEALEKTRASAGYQEMIMRKHSLYGGATR